MRFLGLLVVWATLTGCVSKGDVNVEKAGEKPTCNSVCDSLQAETFGSCKKWTDHSDCIAECQDHSPTEAGLACVQKAETCEEFKACDSMYDIF